MSLPESEFYKLCDVVEEFSDITDGYYPTVEELKDHNVEENIEKYLVILAYFSFDPFKRMNLTGKDNKDYLDMVAYTKKLLYSIELTS